jgi:N4-(beta-N-acetylglucosaminyl)-L-asparaginase
MGRLRYIDMVYYIVRRDGEYAAVCLWGGTPERPRRFAVMDGKGRRIENAIGLYAGTAVDYPPIPKLPNDK